MNAHPWRQTLVLVWHPELRYFDRRVDFLRSLDEKGVLRAFRVEAGELGARLDGDVEFTFESDSLQLELPPSDVDIDFLVETTRVALELIGPVRMRRMILNLQQLAPLEAGYDLARQAALRTFLGRPMESMPLDDFAMLVDGPSRSFPGEFHVEFGIVSEAEIPNRLVRVIGRMGAHGATGDPTPWADRELPAVALFADSAWIHIVDATTPSLEWTEFWASARDEADAFIRTLWEPLDKRLRPSNDSGYEPASTEGAK